MIVIGKHGLRIALSSALLMLAVMGCSRSDAKPGAGKSEAALPVETVAVRTVQMNRTLPVVGTLFAKDEATVSAEVEGRVEETRVEMGDRVKEGQLLARIDTTTYEALATRASANLAKARASAVNADKILLRERELAKEGVASTSQLELALAESDQWRAEVKAAEASERVARLNLEHSQVKAPFDAAISERLASGGDFVKSGAPLFKVVNDSVLKLITHVPERAAGQVRRGQKVVFEVDAHPGKSFEGEVYLISPSVNTTTRYFSLGALVENSDHSIKANSYARGELVLEREVPTLVVPLESVVVASGIARVFVVEQEVARIREVKTGRVVAGMQEITTGLKTNDAVVVNGTTRLYEGARVKLMNGTRKKT